MLTVVLMMFGGILCGYLFRKKQVAHIQQIIMVLIWTLLFLLGLNIGSDKELVSHIGSLGLEALTIAIAATLGSLVAAWFLWRKVR